MSYQTVLQQLICRDLVKMIVSENFASFSGGEGLMARGRDSSKSNWKKSGKKENRGRSSSKMPRDMLKVQCHYCKDFGHYKFDCPNLKGKKKDNSEQQANVAVEESEAETLVAMISPETIQLRNGYATLSIQSVATDSKNGWILDSRCSYHMTPHRGWFSS